MNKVSISNANIEKLFGHQKLEISIGKVGRMCFEAHVSLTIIHIKTLFSFMVKEKEIHFSTKKS